MTKDVFREDSWSTSGFLDRSILGALGRGYSNPSSLPGIPSNLGIEVLAASELFSMSLSMGG